jgi:hypothetical protein
VMGNYTASRETPTPRKNRARSRPSTILAPLRIWL